MRSCHRFWWHYVDVVLAGPMLQVRVRVQGWSKGDGDGLWSGHRLTAATAGYCCPGGVATVIGMAVA